MGATLVVKADPVADDTAGMLHTLKAVSMYTLLLERSDYPLDHAVLLGVMRRDVLLAQPVASDQRSKAAACEHQAVIAAQQKRCRNSTKRPKACDQCLLQSGFSRLATPLLDKCQPSNSRL